MVRQGIWLLLAASAVTGAANFGFWNSETGRAILRDRRAETIMRMRGRVPEATLARLEQAPLGYEVTARGIALSRAMTIASAALLWTVAAHLVFSVLLLRGEVPFGAVLRVFGQGALVWAAAELFLIMLGWTTGRARESSSPVELLPFVDWPGPATFAGSLLRRIDMFDLFWVPLVATGLAAAYEFPAWKIGTGIVCVKLALLLMLALAFRAPQGGAGTPFLRHAP